MATFEIYTDQCIGYTHCGSISESGYAEVELTDDEVETLVNLIRKTGTSDVKEMKLSELFPEIYKKLDEACRAAACDAEESYWLGVGFHDPECHDFDKSEMIEYLKEHNAYDFEYDSDEFLDENGNLDEDALEDAENEYFYETALEDYVYSLPEKEKNDFLRDKVGISVDLDDIDYDVEIPEEIIDMAKN